MKRISFLRQTRWSIVLAGLILGTTSAQAIGPHGTGYYHFLKSRYEQVKKEQLRNLERLNRNSACFSQKATQGNFKGEDSELKSQELAKKAQAAQDKAKAVKQQLFKSIDNKKTQRKELKTLQARLVKDFKQSKRTVRRLLKSLSKEDVRSIVAYQALNQYQNAKNKKLTKDTQKLIEKQVKTYYDKHISRRVSKLPEKQRARAQLFWRHAWGKLNKGEERLFQPAVREHRGKLYITIIPTESQKYRTLLQALQRGVKAAGPRGRHYQRIEPLSLPSQTQALDWFMTFGVDVAQVPRTQSWADPCSRAIRIRNLQPELVKTFGGFTPKAPVKKTSAPSDIAKLKEQLDNTKKKISDLQEQTTKLKSQLGTEKETASKLKTKADSLNHELTKQKAQADAFKKALTDQKTQLNTAKKTIAENKKKLAENKKALTDSKNAITKKDGEIKGLKNNLQTTSQKLSKAQKRLERRLKKLKAKRKELRKLQRAFNKQQKKLADAQKAIALKEKAYQSTKQALKNAQKTIGSQKKQIWDLNKSIAAKDALILSQKKQIDSYKTALDKQLATSAANEAKVTSLTKEVEKFRKLYTTEKQAREKAEQALKALTTKFSDVSKNALLLQKKKAELEIAKQIAEKNVADLKVTASQLKKQKADLAVAKENVEQALAKKTADAAKIETQAAILKKNTDSLKQKFATDLKIIDTKLKNTIEQAKEAAADATKYKTWYGKKNSAYKKAKLKLKNKTAEAVKLASLAKKVQDSYVKQSGILKKLESNYKTATQQAKQHENKATEYKKRYEKEQWNSKDLQSQLDKLKAKAPSGQALKWKQDLKSEKEKVGKLTAALVEKHNQYKILGNKLVTANQKIEKARLDLASLQPKMIETQRKLWKLKEQFPSIPSSKKSNTWLKGAAMIRGGYSPNSSIHFYAPTEDNAATRYRTFPRGASPVGTSELQIQTDGFGNVVRMGIFHGRGSAYSNSKGFPQQQGFDNRFLVRVGTYVRGEMVGGAQGGWYQIRLNSNNRIILQYVADPPGTAPLDVRWPVYNPIES